MILGEELRLESCPHCRVDRPNMQCQATFQGGSINQPYPKMWVAFTCARCGGAVVTGGMRMGFTVTEIFPEVKSVSEEIPERAREYLLQAMQSLQSPAGAVILAASAVDAMLKNKGFEKGTLNDRINEAAKDHLITKEMAEWAHQVRLDANSQRHADNSQPLPTMFDAEKSIRFAEALGQFLFVLPALVKSGMNAATGVPPQLPSSVPPRRKHLPSS
jgi:hypothetical protein